MSEKDKGKSDGKFERKDNAIEKSRVVERPKPVSNPPTQRDRSNVKDKK